jgi:hypothetical protein
MGKKDKYPLNGQLGGHNVTSSTNRSALEGPQKSASTTKKKVNPEHFQNEITLRVVELQVF